ncbi:MAG TPA: hypothetical protein VF281_02175 [Candidatus Saccharimonadales bacterium]
MSEFHHDTNTTPEQLSEIPSVREQLESLASDEAFSDEAVRLRQELANSPQADMLAATEIKIDELRAQSLQAANSVAIKQLRNQQLELESDERFVEYKRLKKQIEDLEKPQDRTCTIDSDSPETELLLTALHLEVDMTQAETAPFMNYKDNTAEAWQYVPDAAVRDYLESRLFVDLDRTRLEGNRINIRNDGKSSPFAIPASLFVSASGFESWAGRRDGIDQPWHSMYGAESMSSINVMKHYASLETEIPPVSEVNVFVQPDGYMFADNNEESHRIGAAFLRGDTTVKAHKVNFVILDHNILEVTLN